VVVRTVAAACRLVGTDRLAALVADDDHHRLDLSDDFDAKMVSAFSEVFNNIVLHGYSEDAAGEVEIELEPGADSLVVRVIDHGRSFDLDRVERPDIDDMPEHGLGLFIIEACVDEFAYAAGPPNVATLVKHRPNADAYAPRTQRARRESSELSKL
jgi:serine/threonine-protein kinase RsbW